MAMIEVYVQIRFPSTVSKEEAIERAKRLVPGVVGSWTEEQASDVQPVGTEQGWIVGNLEIGEGAFEPDGEAEFGPDDAGVSISWETP